MGRVGSGRIQASRVFAENDLQKSRKAAVLLPIPNLVLLCKDRFCRIRHSSGTSRNPQPWCIRTSRFRRTVSFAAALLGTASARLRAKSMKNSDLVLYAAVSSALVLGILIGVTLAFVAGYRRDRT